MSSVMDKFLSEFQSEIDGRDISKAADPLLTTVMNSASLRRELADHFINLVVDESELLKLVRVHRTDAPSGDLTKLNVTTYVTEAATENTDSGNTRRPSDTVVTFNTVKTRSALNVTGEWTEDNVGGQGGKAEALRAFYSAIANDMETLAIEGDSSNAGTTDYDRLVGANDGFHVLTTAAAGAHVVNAGATQASYKLMSEVLRGMPTKWKRNKTDLKWIMSWGAAQSLTDEYATRSTLFGDQIRHDGILGTVLGIPVQVVPLIPEDLTLTGTNGTTGTFIWLCNPQSMIFVIQRDFKAEWERVPRADRDELTIHMRSDFIVEETDAIAKAINVSTWTSHGYYGA